MQLKSLSISFILVSALHSFLLWGTPSVINESQSLSFSSSKSTIKVNIKKTSSSVSSPKQVTTTLKPKSRKENKSLTPRKVKKKTNSSFKVGSGVLNRQAKLVQKISPKYPHLSAVHGEQGTVSALVTINKEGLISRIDLKQSSGHLRLDEEFKRVLSKAVFLPATSLGKPVSTTKEISFTFKLD